MHVLFVRVHVKPEFLDQYLKATIAGDAHGSVTNEPGCLRFDVIQDEKEPTLVYFYEVYRDQAAFQEHTKAPHFLAWRDKVKEWVDGPSEVVRGATLFPEDSTWKKAI